MMPLKVLVVIDSLGVGGAEMLVSQLHDGLLQRNVVCEYYLLRSDGSEIERDLKSRATVYFPCNASVYSPLHVAALTAHFKRFRYNVIHVHLFPAQLWVAIAAAIRRISVPLITTEHSTSNRRRNIWYRPIDRWMYSRYETVACISEAVKRNLLEWLPGTASSLTDCANGVDLEKFQHPAKTLDLKLPNSGLKVISVGRLEPLKDHQTILRAVALVPAAQLILVGTGSQLEGLKALSRELRIQDRVHFLGTRKDIPALLQSCDIYVQSSLWEGFGIAAVEAMAAGLPVITTNVPGLADVVGEAGLKFVPGDHQQLARHIEEIAASHVLRKKLSLLSKHRSQNFSLSRTAEMYARLYEEVTFRECSTQSLAV